MARTQRFTAFLLPFALTVACSSGRDDDDTSIIKNKDAGADAGMQDTGVAQDAGPNDTGVTGPCDPINNTGCVDQGTACVFNTTDNEVQCRIPGMAMHEQTCDQIQHDCEPGYACINLGDGPKCYRVCDADNATVCSNVTGMADQYSCVGLTNANNEELLYGVCVGLDDCVPYDDQCPTGEYCAIADAQGGTACAPEGPNGPGDECGNATGRCMKGGICVQTMMGQPATCREPCDPANDQCSQGACVAVANGWGICN